MTPFAPLLAAFLRNRPRAAATTLGALAVVLAIALVMAPWFQELRTFGFHDWDAQTAHRYLTLLTLLRYHEFPGWNPFACGGFPAWSYVEADTILVSPFLPAYLVLPMSVALRVEVLGMAVLGAAGAWAVASWYTESRAGRALVVVLWAVNGRWALQAASGHTWHLAYAFMPWCLLFFERARSVAHTVNDFAWGSAVLAMLVYAGGIYPLPHTVLLLSVYATVLTMMERSLRPLVTLASLGVLGALLAAPKLLPLLDGFGKVPRLIDSNETLDLGAFVTLLTSRDQAFYARPARVTPYGWHEWGMYIGVPGATVLLLGLIVVQGRREAALKAVGVLFLVLGFGSFHPAAPWTLLHRIAPVFRSQHVPSRFHYTAVLLLALVAAVGVGRFIRRWRWQLPWLDAVAAAVVVGLAIDIGLVAQKPMAASMWMVPPDRIPRDRPFHFEQEPPFSYKRRDWAGPMYLAMLGNTGVINCYGTPPFDRRGAQPVTAPNYHGEAYVVSKEGILRTEATAKVVEWSPNRATIEVAGAEEGALVVYNMNYDEGWHADAGPVVSYRNTLALQVRAGSSIVRFSYRPPYLRAGLLAAVLAVGAIWAARRCERGNS